MFRNRIQRSASLLSVTVAGLALAASSASGQGCVVTKCTWDGDPNKETTYTDWETTDEGILWDTEQRKCTTVWSGPATWKTFNRNKTCSDSWGVSVNGLGIPSVGFGGAYGHSDSPPTNCEQGPGTATRCTTQSSCLWTSEVAAVDHFQIDTNGADGFSVGGFGRVSGVTPGIRPARKINYYYETRLQHESLYNAWANSTVTFDGVNIPYGSSIDLGSYAPGNHVYRVTANFSNMVPILIFNINIQPSSRLEQIDNFTSVVPMATMRYHNDTPFDQLVDLTLNPVEKGLLADVDVNQFCVPARSSYDFKVEFYTEDGYVFFPRSSFTVEIDARFGDPSGNILATGKCVGIEAAAEDVNTDGRVDFADSALVASALGQTVSFITSGEPRVDVVPDGVVDMNDLAEVIEESFRQK